MGTSELLASTGQDTFGTIPTTRQSALAFTEGVRGGWLASDLAVWIEDHLLEPNRLVLREPGTVQVVEPRVGTVLLGRKRPTSPHARAQSAVQVVSLLVAARDRIVRMLKASVDSDDASYVHAALYAGRVSREAWSGRARRMVRVPDRGCGVERPGSRAVRRRRADTPDGPRARAVGVRGLRCDRVFGRRGVASRLRHSSLRLLRSRAATVLAIRSPTHRPYLTQRMAPASVVPCSERAPRRTTLRPA